MIREVEILTLDLRYESYRMKNPAFERKLSVSIQERGIEEPLEGVTTAEGPVLLNGFKRLRCARKLKIGLVPFLSLAEDEAAGIIAMLRISNNRSLSILEQARFIDDLHTLHSLSVADIAEILFRSKSWVSMRRGLIGEMSETVREKLFNGAFPVYSYMYTMRQFMRMNGIPKQEVETFIEAVAGKKLSTREIDQLAHGYFRGPESFREEIHSGNLTLALDRINQVPDAPDGCNEFERVLLKDLEILAKYMRRTMSKCCDKRIQTRAFRAQAHLLVAGILSRVDVFTRTMGEFHDRTGQT